MTCPGRYSGFQATGMIKWWQKSKTKKIPRASNTNPPPKKSLDKKSTSKKFHAEFSSLIVLNIFQKEVNDKARKINQEFNVCVCSGIHWHNQESSVCLNTQKSPYLHVHQATQKNICPIFITIENFNPPKNMLRSSPSLEIRSTSPGITCGNLWLSLLLQALSRFSTPS